MGMRIVHAGIDDRMRRKLRQASEFLGGKTANITVEDWDGNSGHVLVADGRDPMGAQAVQSAQRAQVPVITVIDPSGTADSSQTVTPDCNTAKITRVLSDALGVGAAPEQTALCRLATEDSLRGQDLNGDYLGLTVALRPSVGRAFAYSKSDFQTLAQGLATPRWRFTAPAAAGNADRTGLASMSLDSLLMRGAHAGAESLPPFPDGHYQLDDWPDLGGVADLVYPLRVTQVLLKGPLTPAEIASVHGLPPHQVTACLWALRASAQLQVRQGSRSASAPAANRGGSGLLARLGARFGLLSDRQPQ
jgi:hypothetical protein